LVISGLNEKPESASDRRIGLHPSADNHTYGLTFHLFSPRWTRLVETSVDPVRTETPGIVHVYISVLGSKSTATLNFVWQYEPVFYDSTFCSLPQPSL